ncbi:MAG: hypothetical protein HY553_07490 [Elusimicrobia bacterium]|nr:hypothetical protein [Elusimicrobiota bacterium]
MEQATERLEPRLRASALLVLRDHHVSADELSLELAKPGRAASSVISGHRIRIHLDDASATLVVRAGRWSGRRADFPSAGAFVAAFEAALSGALSDR